MSKAMLSKLAKSKLLPLLRMRSRKFLFISRSP